MSKQADASLPSVVLTCPLGTLKQLAIAAHKRSLLFREQAKAKGLSVQTMRKYIVHAERLADVARSLGDAYKFKKEFE